MWSPDLAVVSGYGPKCGGHQIGRPGAPQPGHDGRAASDALADPDDGSTRWVTGVRGLGDADLVGRCREARYAESSMAELVPHLDRELIHHLAEVALLRDVYLHRTPVD